MEYRADDPFQRGAVRLAGAEWEAAWADECERRIGEYERGETVAEDFDVFMERMRQKYLSK